MEIIQDDPHERVPFREMIRKFCMMMRECNSSISFMLKEANKCADFITEHGEDQDEPLVIMKDPPVDLWRLLNIDHAEVIFNSV